MRTQSRFPRAFTPTPPSRSRFGHIAAISLSLSVVAAIGCDPPSKSTPDSGARPAERGPPSPGSPESGSSAHAPRSAVESPSPVSRPVASTPAAAHAVRDMPSPSVKLARVAVGGFTMDIPRDWLPATALRPMRIAEYALPASPGESESASLIVFHFGEGGGGTIPANLDRWRGQFVESGEPSPGETSEFSVGDVRITVFEKAGVFKYTTSPMSADFTPKPGWRMHAAIVQAPGGPYYFRTVGPEAVVNAHRDALTHALQSIQTKSD